MDTRISRRNILRGIVPAIAMALGITKIDKVSAEEPVDLLDQFNPDPWLRGDFSMIAPIEADEFSMEGFSIELGDYSAIDSGDDQEFISYQEASEIEAKRQKLQLERELMTSKNTIKLTDASGFSRWDYVVIGDEWMLISEINGNELTVIRDVFTMGDFPPEAPPWERTGFLPLSLKHDPEDWKHGGWVAVGDQWFPVGEYTGDGVWLYGRD